MLWPIILFSLHHNITQMSSQICFYICDLEIMLGIDALCVRIQACLSKCCHIQQNWLLVSACTGNQHTEERRTENWVKQNDLMPTDHCLITYSNCPKLSKALILNHYCSVGIFQTLRGNLPVWEHSPDKARNLVKTEYTANTAAGPHFPKDCFLLNSIRHSRQMMIKWSSHDFDRQDRQQQ